MLCCCKPFLLCFCCVSHATIFVKWCKNAVQCSEALTENCEREWWENKNFFFYFIFRLTHSSVLLSSLSHIFIFPISPFSSLYNVITSTATRTLAEYVCCMLFACLLAHSLALYVVVATPSHVFSFFQWSIEDSIVSRALDCVYLSHFTSFRAKCCLLFLPFLFVVAFFFSFIVCMLNYIAERNSFQGKQSWVLKRLVHSPEAFSLSFSRIFSVIFFSVCSIKIKLD